MNDLEILTKYLSKNPTTVNDTLTLPHYLLGWDYEPVTSKQFPIMALGVTGGQVLCFANGTEMTLMQTARQQDFWDLKPHVAALRKHGRVKAFSLNSTYRGKLSNQAAEPLCLSLGVQEIISYYQDFKRTPYVGGMDIVADPRSQEVMLHNRRTKSVTMFRLGEYIS